MAEVNKENNCYKGELITDSPDFEALVNELKTKDLITFQVYADIKSAVSSTLTGIAVSYSDLLKLDNGKVKLNNKTGYDNKVYYIPLHHENLETQLDADYVFNLLRPIFENENIKKNNL